MRRGRDIAMASTEVGFTPTVLLRVLASSGLRGVGSSTYSAYADASNLRVLALCARCTIAKVRLGYRKCCTSPSSTAGAYGCDLSLSLVAWLWTSPSAWHFVTVH